MSNEHNVCVKSTRYSWEIAEAKRAKCRTANGSSDFSKARGFAGLASGDLNHRITTPFHTSSEDSDA
jgi:hypothetical protein